MCRVGTIIGTLFVHIGLQSTVYSIYSARSQTFKRRVYEGDTSTGPLSHSQFGYPEEMKNGKEISVVSHSFLLDNYEIYVRPK